MGAMQTTLPYSQNSDFIVHTNRVDTIKHTYWFCVSRAGTGRGISNKLEFEVESLVSSFHLTPARVQISRLDELFPPNVAGVTPPSHSADC